jgi:hypothetical protein
MADCCKSIGPPLKPGGGPDVSPMCRKRVFEREPVSQKVGDEVVIPVPMAFAFQFDDEEVPTG